MVTAKTTQKKVNFQILSIGSDQANLLSMTVTGMTGHLDWTHEMQSSSPKQNCISSQETCKLLDQSVYKDRGWVNQGKTRVICSEWQKIFSNS